MTLFSFNWRRYFNYRYLIPILLAVILFSVPLLSFSQSVTDVLKYFQDEFPEIEKYPNAIYEDSKGFLWWGGYYKIQLYDGYKLKSYYVHELFNTEEQIGDYPTVDFLEDSEQDFLILFDHGLMFYDTVYQDLTRFDFEGIAQDSVIHIDYTCLYEDDQHFICIGTSIGTVIRIPVKVLKNYLDHSKRSNNIRLIDKSEFSTFAVDEPDLLNTGKYMYMEILQDKLNNYWIPTDTRVYKITRKTPDKFVSVPYVLNSYRNNQPPAGTRGAMFIDDHKNLWIGRGNSIFMVDFTKDQEFPFTEFQFDHFTWWISYAKGELWMSPSKAIYGYKLNYVNNKPIISKIAKYKFDDMDQSGQWHSLKNNYRTKEDLFFIQDWSHGLVMLDLKNQKPFRKIFHIPGDSTSIPHNVIISIFEDHSGTFWMNEWGGELIYDFILTDHKFIHFKEVKFDLGPPNVLYFLEDSKHNLWMFSNYTDIFIANLDDFYKSNQKVLKGYKLTSENFEMSPGELLDINSVVIDENDVIWASAENGIYYYKKDTSVKKGRIKYNEIFFKRLISIGTNNPNPAFRSGFLLDPVHSEMIKGTNKDHVIIISPNSMDFKVLKIDFEGYNDKFVNFWYLTTDLNGDIWGQDWLYNYKITLLKNSNGEYTNARFKRFTATDGFPYQINRLICDNNNNIWSFVQGLGIFMYNQSTEEIKTFKGQQIIKGEAWGGAQYCDRYGNIYLQATDGITIFHPDSLQENIIIPEVHITDIKVLNQSIFNNPDSSLLDHYRINNTLRLPYSSNNISFEFASLSLTDPKSNKYSYCLEGYDENPAYVDASFRIASYPKLPSGHYTFKVTGSNNNDIWNKVGTSIQLIILPPWYSTIPAYIVYALILIGLITYWRIIDLRRIRLKHEVQLKQVESDKLRELDHMKSEFFSNISHEFRTPLTLILGPLENIIKGSFKGNLPKEAEIMKRNAHRLLDLINQILDLSKIDAGKLKLHAAEQDLTVFIRDAVSNFESTARNKKIQLISHIPKKSMMVYFDSEKMEDVLENIIINALKFSSEGDKVMIRLKLHDKVDGEYKREDKPMAEITIQDTGIGIPHGEQDRIFDRFYQIDRTSSRKHEGAGIGLSLANELVKLHHGTITVKSWPGKGTLFIILLPIGRDHLSDDEIISKPGILFPEYDIKDISDEKMIRQLYRETNSDIKISNRSSGLPLILLVEDNADMRHFIKNNLDHQFVFIEADNGIKGFNTAIITIPDLIISDVLMPEMDGIEFCRKIREDDRTSHIPFILLTARADKESRIIGFDTGADDYIIKPFEQEVMISRMNNLLKERTIQREKFTHQWAKTSIEISSTITDDKFILTINSLLGNNYNRHDFGTRQFISGTGMSRSVLFRKLKAVTNLSPSIYLRNYRLIKASQLISSGEKNISLVAYSTGFNNLSYFSRCFKRMFKKAPHEFYGLAGK
jgi:signal transduction histidine kinase/AraC-like DNA-binding protein